MKTTHTHFSTPKWNLLIQFCIVRAYQAFMVGSIRLKTVEAGAVYREAGTYIAPDIFSYKPNRLTVTR